MTEEVEFAMQYSEERIRSAQLEERLFALMFEVVPYLAAASALIEQVIKQETEEATQSIKKLVTWQADLEAMMMVNLFDPVGRTNLVKQDALNKISGLSDLPESAVDNIHETLKIAVDKTRARWNELAEERGFDSIDRMTRGHVHNCQELIASRGMVLAMSKAPSTKH